jgi:S1-C subfamily serine protease
MVHGKINRNMKYAGLLMILSWLVIVGLVLLAVSGSRGYADRPSEEERIQQLSPVIAESVVAIETFGQGGTGFYIGPHTIITNWHVVAKAGDTVSITEGNGSYKAKVGYRDEMWDLAVLTTEHTGKPIPMAGKNPAIGTTVITAGFPKVFGLTVSKGLVSGSWNYYMIMSMDINPGNSGGPLVNLLGEVVGVVAASGKDAQGIGAGISIEDVKQFLQRGGVSIN